MKNRLPLVSLLPILLLVACSQSPVGPHSSVSDDGYTISITALHQDSVSFSYTTSSGNRFIFPFHYFDNPTELIEGSLIRDLTVIDANGFPIDVRFRTDRSGNKPYRHPAGRNRLPGHVQLPS